MFRSNKPPKQSGPITNLVGLGTVVEGDIRFVGGMGVNGQVIGNITAVENKNSLLVMSETASVTGAVRVAHLVLNGSIEGPVYADHYIELQSKSRIVGDVYYHTLEMHPGAVVIGQLVHMLLPDQVGTVSALPSGRGKEKLIANKLPPGDASATSGGTDGSNGARELEVTVLDDKKGASDPRFPKKG